MRCLIGFSDDSQLEIIIFILILNRNWWSGSGGSSFGDAEYEVLLFFYCISNSHLESFGRQLAMSLDYRGHRCIKLTARAMWCVVWTLEDIHIYDLGLRTCRCVELDFRKWLNGLC